jgi:hypothetical protein
VSATVAFLSRGDLHNVIHELKRLLSSAGSAGGRVRSGPLRRPGRWGRLNGHRTRSPYLRLLARGLELLVLDRQEAALPDLVAAGLIRPVDGFAGTASTSSWRKRLPVLLSIWRNDMRSAADTAG